MHIVIPLYGNCWRVLCILFSFLEKLCFPHGKVKIRQNTPLAYGAAIKTLGNLKVNDHSLNKRFTLEEL